MNERISYCRLIKRFVDALSGVYNRVFQPFFGPARTHQSTLISIAAKTFKAVGWKPELQNQIVTRPYAPPSI